MPTDRWCSGDFWNLIIGGFPNLSKTVLHSYHFKLPIAKHTMKIIPLSEGAFTIDKTKVFVPFDTEKEELNARPAGSLLVEIQPFVVVTDKDVILLDTGLGYNDAGGKFQLHANLEKAGIQPSQVTK